MNEVDRDKISYSVEAQGNTRNESSDYKKFNYSDKTFDKQENDYYEKDNSYHFPVKVF